MKRFMALFTILIILGSNIACEFIPHAMIVNADTGSNQFCKSTNSMRNENVEQNIDKMSDNQFGNVSSKCAYEEIRFFKLELKDFDPVKILKGSAFYKVESTDEKLNFRNAVIRFQSSINEPITGELTDIDKKVLEASVMDALPAFSDYVTGAPTKGKWITINKTTRIITLYEGNKPIKKYPAALGAKPSYTPEGKFSIVVLVKNPAWGGGGYAKPVAGGSPKNPLGYRWMGLSYKGGGRYGLHGTNAPYSIGTNASHGCIRMINSDSEELFDTISKNTIVWIGTQEQLYKWGVNQGISEI